MFTSANREKNGRKFGGSLSLIIWIIATLGAGYYSYRCLFGTRGMIDQYGAGDGAAPLVSLEHSPVLVS